ncbi:MAG: hypothetical protein ACK50J_15490 [Planctomyces sp.]
MGSIPLAHQVELTLERLDLQSAITNLTGHDDLALRFASGQVMGTNGLSGRKSSADVQTMDIIRTGPRRMVNFATTWLAFGPPTHSSYMMTGRESSGSIWIPAWAGITSNPKFES